MSRPQNGLQAHYLSEKHVLSDRLLALRRQVIRATYHIGRRRFSISHRGCSMGEPNDDKEATMNRGDPRGMPIVVAALIVAAACFWGLPTALQAWYHGTPSGHVEQACEQAHMNIIIVSDGQVTCTR